MKQEILKEYIRELILVERKKKRKSKNKRPGKKGYYKGTRESNKSMAKEINKCAKEPRPKSCYDYWDADKKYDKSRKGKKK
jgi:hypothetical protein